jgi:hypothetical protein
MGARDVQQIGDRRTTEVAELGAGVVHGRAGQEGQWRKARANTALEGLCDGAAHVAELIRDRRREIDRFAYGGTILVPLKVPAGGIGVDVDAQFGNG